MVSEEDTKCIKDNIKQSKRLFEEVGVYAYFDKENMTTVESLLQGYKELKKHYINPSETRISYYDGKKGTTVAIEGFIPKSLVEEMLEELNKNIDLAIDNSKGGLDEDFINKGTKLIAQKKVLEELLKGDK